MKISIQDTNAVHELEFSMEQPGVYVARGPNGSGKTQTLGAIAYALGAGGIKPTVRNGAAAGKVVVDGLTLRIGKNVTSKGKAEIIGVDGPEGIDALIDPQIKDPEKADAARMKALLRLAGVEADEAMFSGLPDFADVAGGTVATSLVELAANVRRAYHEAAKASEDEAAAWLARSVAARATVQGVDVKLATVPGETLDTNYREAVRECNRLDAEWGAAAKSRGAAEEARKRLDAITSEATPIPLTEATERYAKVSAERAKHREKIAALKAQLADAEIELKYLDSRVRGDEDQMRRSKQHEETLAALRGQIDAGVLPGPSEADIQTAKQNATAAKQAIEARAVAVRAWVQLESASDFEAAAKVQAAKATSYRSAAWLTDGILSSQVATLGQPLLWKDGRLVYVEPGRERFFGELSWGERGRVVCKMLAGIHGDGYIAILDQRTWEGMDARSRAEFIESAEASGLRVVTGECELDPAKIGEPIRVERRTA